ncbi:MAG: alpha/beta hydrolase [Phycisphaerales bacterium]
MRTVFCMLLALIAMALSAPSLTHAQVGISDEAFPYDNDDPIVGHYLGQVVLSRGPSAMQLIVERAPGGQPIVTISIPNVSMWQQPCTEVEIEDRRISLRLPDVARGQVVQYVVRGEFTLDPAGQELTGAVSFQRVAARAQPMPNADVMLHRTPRPMDLDTAQSFSGEVLHEPTPYPITLVVAETPEGNWVGHADLPGNGAFGLFIYNVEVFEDEIRLVVQDRVAALVSLFKDDPDSDTWEGVFQRQTEEEIRVSRDSYLRYELQFTSSRGHLMSGKLTVPSGEGPHPCAVIASTFGPHDRNGLTLTHAKLGYDRIADHLTRNGIAVFRYDERGMGRSGGDFNECSTADFARDLNRAIARVAEVGVIDADNIGIIGHGEGGVAAAFVNMINQHPVAFNAFINVPLTKGSAVLMYEKEQELANAHPQVRESSLQIYRSSLEAVQRGEAEEDIRNALRELLETHRAGLSEETLAKLPSLDEEIDERIGDLFSSWTKDWLRLDSLGAIDTIETPVFGAYASMDREVDPKVNAELLRKFGESSGAPVEVEEYTGYNHLFQKVVGNPDATYRELGDPFDGPLLDDLVSWIKAATN